MCLCRLLVSFKRGNASGSSSLEIFLFQLFSLYQRCAWPFPHAFPICFFIASLNADVLPDRVPDWLPAFFCSGFTAFFSKFFPSLLRLQTYIYTCSYLYTTEQKQVQVSKCISLYLENALVCILEQICCKLNARVVLLKWWESLFGLWWVYRAMKQNFFIIIYMNCAFGSWHSTSLSFF